LDLAGGGEHSRLQALGWRQKKVQRGGPVGPILAFYNRKLGLFFAGYRKLGLRIPCQVGYRLRGR
jgi:hypothetical protein